MRSVGNAGAGHSRYMAAAVPAAHRAFIRFARGDQAGGVGRFGAPPSVLPGEARDPQLLHPAAGGSQPTSSSRPTAEPTPAGSVDELLERRLALAPDWLDVPLGHPLAVASWRRSAELEQLEAAPGTRRLRLGG